jgi:phosphoribosylanthranilate isomerase
MATAIKFCGLTRSADADQAAALGASYVGVIFASGPRLLSAARAREVLANVPPSVARVGVFAAQPAAEIARVADDVGLDVVQLHGAADVARVETLRRAFDGQIWVVERVSGRTLPASFSASLEAADAVLLDALVDGALGGTGVALPWHAIADALSAVRGERRIVLAGGLRPENVGQAIAALAPDVVDVSSGVEAAPGIKDHDRMRAFRDAVFHAPIGPTVT